MRPHSSYLVGHDVIMPDFEDELTRLTNAIANLFMSDPQCVAASGLLVQSAVFLGYDLKPRPVSMLTQLRDGSSAAVAFGVLAQDFARANGSVEQNTRERRWGNDFDDVGHMIVTSDDGWIFDPTFQQLSAYGFPLTPIIGQVDDVHPESGHIDLGDAELQIRYWPVDDCTGWRNSYRQYVATHLEDASELARMVRQREV